MAGECTDETRAEGPWFEDLTVGRSFPAAPALTLTEGRAAVHQSIVGDRLRLALDDDLARAVTGRAPLAHPALVWDVAIGQSTVVTQHVRANLFYRDLALLRLPALGDTLSTRTTVLALRQNSRRPDRAPTGLALLGITCADQEGRPVLDFRRCAMLPLREDVDTGWADDLTAAGDVHPSASPGGLTGVTGVTGWDLSAWRVRVSGLGAPPPGTVIEVVGGDVVSSAPELARLTLNIAAVHHDAQAAGGRRLVYGGHTVGIALGQVTRALPDLVTVPAWRSCEHLGPVHEGDTLHTRIVVGSHRSLPPPGPDGARVVGLRALVQAQAPGAAERRPVLDWAFDALFA